MKNGTEQENSHMRITLPLLENIYQGITLAPRPSKTEEAHIETRDRGKKKILFNYVQRRNVNQSTEVFSTKYTQSHYRHLFHLVKTGLMSKLSAFNRLSELCSYEAISLVSRHQTATRIKKKIVANCFQTVVCFYYLI